MLQKEKRDMTEQEQIIAIAEFCGWKVGSFPNYLHDLNAMHEAEKKLSYPQFRQYKQRLTKICAKVSIYRERERNPVQATAAQRAEAFIKAIGSWDEI